MHRNPQSTIASRALSNPHSSSTIRNLLAGRDGDARYGVLRIAFGLVMLADVSHLYAHWDLFLPTALWPWFPVGPVCLIWLAALGGLIFGFRTAVVLNWICCAVMLGIVAPNEGFQQAAGDSVAIGIAFLLLVLPRLEATAGRGLRRLRSHDLP